MESIVHEALDLICSHGTKGILISSLWPKLNPALSSQGLSLCPNVKRALWTNIVSIPGLQFEPPKKVEYDLMNLDSCESLGLKIVAGKTLRDCSIGLYDVKADDIGPKFDEKTSGINIVQRRTLERLAVARTNGITQSELCKEFGIQGNKIFYQLKKLESKGLIVKQSTVVRTKEAAIDGESRNTSIVSTNMLHLPRYAKHLGCQQRLEIIKEDGLLEEDAKEDVLIKDFLPQIKAICEKLEEAEGKVLIISDIKQGLGYRKPAGHRAWRNILHRLKDANVVEEFCAKVNNKEVNCLRLLKNFSLEHFMPKPSTHGSDSIDSEHHVKGEVTEQILELPIEHQIYDLIDGEGSKGLTIPEVCKRLGINNKDYDTRMRYMFARYGIRTEAESHKRGRVYRYWTPKNFIAKESDNIPSESQIILPENTVYNNNYKPITSDLEMREKSTQDINDVNTSASKENVENENNAPIETQIVAHDSIEHDLHEPELVDEDIIQEKDTSVQNDETSGTKPRRKRRSYQRYPCLSLDSARILREQRILKMLQEEKFLIKPELHKRLENLETEKKTVMDRKTLERSLNKLQQEGLCKCIHVSVPVITNCGRSRTTDVILHPEIFDVSSETMAQIHAKMRSFEIQIRVKHSPKKNDQKLPVLENIQRIESNVKPMGQADLAEVRRANGYVLAKMVRTKLLHIFFWGYISNLPDWGDGYDVENPHSNFKILDLDAAIKAMPVELFLQVVGSTQRYEDMIEKCRKGLCLSDLPLDEYKQIMDTHATGRISRLIDILRRLKLIRLVNDGGIEDVPTVPYNSLAHALQLKPYMEEPVSVVASSLGFFSPDMRPQIRHDFILSSRKAVDEYWNTLEYCYSAAHSKAALHAFPGSAVHEVFRPRSWAATRVMSAEQRAELIECVVNEDPNKKLTYKECQNIAKRLNLTLEQVLRVFYDKRNQRLTKIEGVLNGNYQESHEPESIHASTSRKRRRRSSRISAKNKKTSLVDEDRNSVEEEEYNNNENPEDLNRNLQKEMEEAIEEEEQNEDEGKDDFIKKCALSRLTPKRQRKYSWGEKADRILVIKYAKRRAALGAKFNRVDWASIPNLPAPPETCRRRMATLNSNVQFRKSLMRLCTLLTERYAKYLEKFQDQSSSNPKVMLRDTIPEECNDPDNNWDNFDDPDIQVALETALRYKKSSKTDIPVDPQDTDVNSSAPPRKVRVRSKHTSGQKRSRAILPPRYVKFLNEGISIYKRAYESVAVSNAIELFKLIFLSKSSAPEVPKLLADTLRRYSEHDLFTAFYYLREKKIMMGGSGTSPFNLSQHFLQTLSFSPFPINTGKRALKCINWLQESENDLIDEGVNLPEDLQCGDTFHLCAMLLLGELSITPCLPDEGVGEAEDTRTLKRKSDCIELSNNEGSSKKSRSLIGNGECEVISRREKGFPGIKLHLSCAKISRINALELYKDQYTPITHNNTRNTRTENEVTDLFIEPEPEGERDDNISLDSVGPTVPCVESAWEAMTRYAKHILSSCSYQESGFEFHPELFKNVCSAIQKAGDQGLSTMELVKIMETEGEKLLEIVIQVLEAFGRALKVNAYGSIHVVDSLYRSKYFLTSLTNFHQERKRTLLRKSKEQHEITETRSIEEAKEMNVNGSDLHKVTILNRPEVNVERSGEIENNDGDNGYNNTNNNTNNNNNSEKEISRDEDSRSYRPILPWTNTDGTLNDLVYRGLVRRLLGIIMQNPGILEESIIAKMPVLNPQNCRKLLEMMILDNYVTVRKIPQTISVEPPAMLRSLLGSRFKKSPLICQEHFFANHTSTLLL